MVLDNPEINSKSNLSVWIDIFSQVLTKSMSGWAINNSEVEKNHGNS